MEVGVTTQTQSDGLESFAVAPGIATVPVSSSDTAFFPNAPESLADTGLQEHNVEALVMKALHLDRSRFQSAII